jgi:hypothetical protein
VGFLRRVPLVVLLPAAAVIALVPWIAFCARTYPDHPLYFDHSMYQYTAWCIRHGARLYRDVAVPDGPFITWLHAAIQSVAGESDRAFRWADLAIQLGGTLAIGAVLAPRRVRVPWALAIASLWLAQYFHYDWLWTAQREAYYALVGYLGMALCLLASYRRGALAIALAVAGGLCAGTQLFDKHIGLIFVALAFVPSLVSRRWRLAGWTAAGVALAIAACLALLAATGSIADWWFWYTVVPRPYRFLMGNADFFPLLAAMDLHTTVPAVLALAVGGVCVWRRWLPRRYLGFVAAPLLFLVAMLLQRKGHPYQAHPITAGTYLCFALIAMHLVRRHMRIAGTAVLALLVGDLSYQLATGYWIDPDPPAATAQLGAPHVNFGDMAGAAAKVAEITRDDDRVFAYGPAARLLYEAQRLPAVPPFANFFLNVNKAAVIPLTDDQRATLEDVQRRIAHRACPRLREMPAAVVVCDGADWSGGPGLADAREICPQLAYVTPPTYVEVGVYGCWHVLARSGSDK